MKTAGQSLSYLLDKRESQPSERVRELLRFAHKRFNKHPFAIIKEWFPLTRGSGQLTLQDYFLYQLYDDNKYSPEDKARFISEQLHTPITTKCCDVAWGVATTEDKWISYNLLEKFGFKTPKTIAVIDQSPRSFGSDPKITSPEGLKNFLRETNVYPIFAKPNIGIQSIGNFIITGIEDNYVLLDQSEPQTFESLFEKIIDKQTYLMQTCIVNHPKVRAFSKYVATVRTINLVNQDSVVTPFSAFKIPSMTSIADNFWRQGNMIADVDLESGAIRRVIRGKGIHTEELDIHPETGDRLIDMPLPYWDELRRVNAACARLFAPLRYHSLDIALTSDGPVIVEVNIGGSFVLPQLASGTGLLTDEIRDFFESCGWKFCSSFLPSIQKVSFQGLRRKN
ncbi:MAG: sugar-transfer associated ATP-grasp domain-containing protein [Planctomycetota bacterium]|jgi:hypothetical protein